MGLRSVRFLLVCSSAVSMSVAVAAQRDGGSTASLKGVAIPQRPDLPRYVANPEALVVLGKSLFWDVQVGSDGRTACGTCHFHAGADHRVTNAVAGPATSTDNIQPNTTLTTGDQAWLQC
jgi:cytochrome c peroxidase